MPWWSWLILAVIALAVEMFVFDAQFYLVFFGISAAAMGILALLGVGMPEWTQWLVFSIFAVVSMVSFRQRLYSIVRGRTGHVRRQGIGVDDDLSIGASIAALMLEA